MDIILFGMQGSGKGTQGKILAERYGLKVFDMGNALRSMIASGSELGNKIKDTVESGNLVSDDIILEVVEKFLEGEAKGQNVLFDGIPRTMIQSEKLLALLSSHERDAFALDIKISEREAIERLTKRRMCVNCKEIYPAFYKGDSCSECRGDLITRSDDSNLDSINQRLHNFAVETKPVIEDFYKRDRLIEVDGEQAIPDVTEEMIDKAGYLFS
ncbi:nucleoside monophosphate kinase [Patescibacteria group bacterium]|nr:nucleoside monophosphate kinase [Patescibacteria group bacterium]MBU1016446.1 nucleoside monophosphate kinase [Patescibacteria group bacterium]MBU1684944.1 nucleoside monophosphate kinase [Patescibacteria group bacterium]MBU1939028.1 nucleoside monophosphate kinase [Patescibacteria group bacterium]